MIPGIYQITYVGKIPITYKRKRLKKKKVKQAEAILKRIEVLLHRKAGLNG